MAELDRADAAEAEAIVAATRYPPLGRRGAAFGFAHDDYAPGAPAGKIAELESELLWISVRGVTRAT